MSRLLHNAL